MAPCGRLNTVNRPAEGVREGARTDAVAGITSATSTVAAAEKTSAGCSRNTRAKRPGAGAGDA